MEITKATLIFKNKFLNHALLVLAETEVSISMLLTGERVWWL